jgi:F420-dependent methylenetetrahydromethanopterin dehydrogenase
MTAAKSMRPKRRVVAFERVKFADAPREMQTFADDLIVALNQQFAVVQEQLDRIELGIPNGDLTAQVQLVLDGQAAILEALKAR